MPQLTVNSVDIIDCQCYRPRMDELSEDVGRQDMTLEELVAKTHRLLERLAPRQTRYKVSERPDGRTIRYYIAQKLLPRPVSYDGGRARYSGGHLARLVLIKKLQAEHHSLRLIAHELRDASDEEVVRRLLPDSRERGSVSLLHFPAGEKASPEEAPAAGPVTPAEEPGEVVRGTTLRRFHLPGGTVDVDPATLADAEKCLEFTGRLEDLARALQSTHSEKPTRKKP